MGNSCCKRKKRYCVKLSELGPWRSLNVKTCLWSKILLAESTRNEEAELGRLVSYGKVFMKTHTLPDGSFVDQKAKQVADCYEMDLQEVMDQQAADGPENSSEHSTQPTITIEEKNAIFLKGIIILDWASLKTWQGKAKGNTSP